MEFKKWPKIPRLENETYIFTEKLDGTNACVAIGEDGEFHCQSRTRIITPEEDNFGFASWALANKEELLKLGPGYHYGEWWGKGINRGYGLEERRFSLFNVSRWGDHNPDTPACVHAVPTLPSHLMEGELLHYLSKHGSIAAPGWMKPEGAIVYAVLSKTYYKLILDK